MIRALPHQQQPPRPAYCPGCKEGFNNKRRMWNHIVAMVKRGDRRHVPESREDSGQ